jgi:hypothetical protein
MGINDMGEIVGQNASGPTATPLYWASAASAPRALPSAGLSHAESAAGINNAGQIVGRSNPGPYVALLWSSPTSTPTVLPGIPRNAGYVASGINGNGEIVGFGFLEGGPVYWASPSSAPHVLPSGGLIGVNPTSINDLGEIVGSGTPQTSVDSVALYWPPACR